MKKQTTKKAAKTVAKSPDMTRNHVVHIERVRFDTFTQDRSSIHFSGVGAVFRNSSGEPFRHFTTASIRLGASAETVVAQLRILADRIERVCITGNFE